ncbi:methionine biosynthesis protein MetW [Elusimicrobiota bacterium]
MENRKISFEHLKIAEFIDSNSKVLDLGCGNGTLMEYLEKTKNVNIQGIEISEEYIYKCVERGLCVLHADFNKGLGAYQDDSFDFVILSQSLQQVKNIDTVLDESLRVGKKVVIGFPNFAHISLRLDMLIHGRAPVTDCLPENWNNTPNIRFLSIKDFENFCKSKKYKIIAKSFISNGKNICCFPNLCAQQAIFVITK